MIALIVEASLRSLALGLVVWLALAITRPRNPHLHKTVWMTVVLASIAMPFLIGFNVAPEIPAPTYVVSLQAGTDALPRAPSHWLQTASILYALTALALLIRFVAGLARMWRIKRLATVLREPWTQADDVRVSLELRTPATFGSTILLPPEFCEWSETKFAAVMVHERSHVRRGDCYILWLARLHTCLFWINPLAWWIQSRLAALAETTSDDAVVAELGDRTTYAEVLLEIAASHPGKRLMAAAEMASSTALIAARIERIISGIAPSIAPRRRYQFLAVALLLPVVAISAASLRVSPVRLAQADTPPQGVNQDVDENDPLRPRLISGGDPSETEQYYPPTAKVRGLGGMVKVSISIDAQGVPTDVRVLEEEPRDFMFGEAAATIVKTFRFSNPRQQPARFPMKVKFDLKGGGVNPPRDLPPPQSPVGG